MTGQPGPVPFQDGLPSHLTTRTLGPQNQGFGGVFKKTRNPKQRFGGENKMSNHL